MKFLSLPVVAACLAVAAPSFAQAQEEVYVLSPFQVADSMAGARMYQAPTPAITLRKRADYITLALSLVNDSRQAEWRTNELYQTVTDALAKAEGTDIAIQQGLWKLEPGNFRLDIAEDGSDTSSVQLYLRVALEDGDSADALTRRMVDFASELKVAGRTLISVGKPGLAVSNPERFRYELIDAIATDVNRVKGAFGPDLKVSINGVHQELNVRPVNASEVVVWLPYSYSLSEENDE